MDIVLHITGVAPYIMSSDRGVSPLDPLTRELKKYTGKRSKTDDDHQMIQRLEFESRMYWNDEFGPHIPCGNVHKAFVEGARKSKDGKLVEEGLTQLEVSVPLLYEGPRDIQGLYDTGSDHVYTVSVGNQRNRVMRTRPIFREWALNVPFFLDETILDPDRLATIADVTGQRIGLGDRRPAFGRFQTLITAKGGATNGKTTISDVGLAAALA